MFKSWLIFCLISTSAALAQEEPKIKIRVQDLKSASLLTVELPTQLKTVETDHSDFPEPLFTDNNAIPQQGEWRFEVLQALWYLNQWSSRFNQRFSESGEKPLPPIRLRATINLSKNFEGFPPSAEADRNSILLRLGKATHLDPTLLAHEFGHVVHLHLLDTNKTEILKKILPPENDGSLRSYYEAWTVVEGLANIFAATISDSPVIGEQTYFDVAFRVDQQVDLTKLPTLQDYFESGVRSKMICEKYPEEVRTAEDRLKSEYFRKNHLFQPYPYTASALFTFPLWSLRQEIGNEGVQDVVLAVMKNYRPENWSLSSVGLALLQSSPEKHKSAVESGLRKAKLVK